MSQQIIQSLTKTFTDKIEEYGAEVESLRTQLADSVAINKSLNVKVADLAVKAELVSDGVSLAFVNRMNEYEKKCEALANRVESLTVAIVAARGDDFENPDDVAEVVNTKGLWSGFSRDLGKGYNIRALRDTFMMHSAKYIVLHNKLIVKGHCVEVEFDKDLKYLYVCEYAGTDRTKYVHAKPIFADKPYGEKWFWYSKESPSITVIGAGTSSTSYKKYYWDKTLAIGGTMFLGSDVTLHLDLSNACLHLVDNTDDFKIIYYLADNKLTIEMRLGTIFLLYNKDRVEVIAGDKAHELLGGRE